MLELNELTDLRRFASDLHDGWIGASQNDDDRHLIVFCYTARTQFAGHWIADTTLLARGLVVRLTDAGVSIYEKLHMSWNDASIDDIALMFDDALVVARGMRKFFTVDAANSDWGKLKLVDDDEGVTVADDVSIDYNAHASVADKLDGALGIGVRVNGDYIIATKGSFRSDESIEGTVFMRTKHDSRAFADFMDKNLPGFTPLFEIITPGDFHVVQYGKLADIVFLGLLENATGWWIPAALLGVDERTADRNAVLIPGKFGFITPEIYSAKTLGEALQLPAIANHEGMVATLDGTAKQDMFKIKYPLFLMLQRLKNSTSDKALREFISNMNTDEIMHGNVNGLADMVPADAREAAKPILTRLNQRANDIYLHDMRDAVNTAINEFNKVKNTIDFTDRDSLRDYAMIVNSMNTSAEIKGIMFALKAGVIRGDDNELETAVKAAKRIILNIKSL